MGRTLIVRITRARALDRAMRRLAQLERRCDAHMTRDRAVVNAARALVRARGSNTERGAWERLSRALDQLSKTRKDR